MLKSSSLTAILLLLTSIVSVTAQQLFLPGTYYDQKDRKVSGFISIPNSAKWGIGPLERRDLSNSYIYYKADSLGEETKVQGHKLKAFTMASDSFVVLRNFKISGVKDIINVPIGFCKVIVGDGKVILYSSTSNEYVDTGGGLGIATGVSVGTPSSNTTYLVQQRGSTTVMEVEMGIEEFVTQMSQYMKISDVIVTRIKNREYSYFKTEQLVRDFNAWFSERKSSM